MTIVNFLVHTYHRLYWCYDSSTSWDTATTKIHLTLPPPFSSLVLRPSYKSNKNGHGLLHVIPWRERFQEKVYLLLVNNACWPKLYAKRTNRCQCHWNSLSVLDELNYHLTVTLLKMWNPAFSPGVSSTRRATCVHVFRHDTGCIHYCCYPILLWFSSRFALKCQCNIQ